MKVVTKKLADLHVMEKNIRRHTEKQIREYVRSIEMFGQIKPLVIDETGEILAGNGLFYAMQSMGAETCECYVMKGLTANQKKKLMLADNRVYELGFTDTAIFDEIIRDLGGDIDVPGWDADLLEMLNASVRDANEMIGSYGTYSQDAVEAVNNRDCVDHSDNAAAAGASPSGQASNGEGAAPAQAERVIICPKCGERICL